ncbi:MAG: lipopolysaccharide heptosyltransferase II [Bacteroidota bacterium]|jgi:heptosyltransferase-2
MRRNLSFKGIAPAEKSTYYIRSMSTPIKTLVIRLSSIGDIVLASPLIRIFRKQFPLSQIDFVVRKEYAELVRYNPNISTIIEFDAVGGFGELQRLKENIRRERYDLILDIHNSLRSRYLRFLSGAKKTSVIDKRVIARTMLVWCKKNFYRNIVSVADRYIETAKQYGMENDNKGLELFIPDEIRFKVAEKLTSFNLHRFEKVVGFCPSAKHATKCWPQERFAELGVQLSKDFNARILLFGGHEDKVKCSSIAHVINSLSGEERATDLSGELSLLESAIAMEACIFIVTNDSGLMHIAAAMKKKVVAIFGSTVKEFGFFPVGTENALIERAGLYCRPCSHIGRDSCPEKHFRCMKEIQVEEVMKSIHAISFWT